MPRKSKTWQRSSVRAVLESFGLQKVSCNLAGDMITIATNDSCIHDYLNPQNASREGGEQPATHGILSARNDSCRKAEAFWSRATAAALGLAGFHSEADEVDLQGGVTR